MNMDHDNADEEGQPSEAKKRRIGVRSITEHFDKMIEDESQVNFCFQCGGEHALEMCPDMIDNALNKMRTIMEEQSKSPSSERSRTSKITRGRKDKLPKKSVMPQGKRWNRNRFTEKEEVTKSFYTSNLPTCSRPDMIRRWIILGQWHRNLQKGPRCAEPIST